MPSGSISSMYSSVPQVRGSTNMSLMRSIRGLPRPLYNGRRGMRSPSITSTSRPSTSDSTRTEPRNRITNGMPMISTARPADSDAPVTTQVK